MIIDYTKINNVTVNSQLLKEIYKIMMNFGNENKEVFIMLLGKFEGPSSFVINNYIIPNQIHYETFSGIGVYIPPEEINEMNRVIFESKLYPIGQIHSHPQEAYHSLADDDMAMITSFGQFSIVVPYFGYKEDMSIADFAIYRLKKNGEWKSINNKNKKKIFKVISDE